MLHLMATGLLASLSPLNVVLMLGGVLLGMVFGAMPGLTGAAAMTMLLPVTFSLPPQAGILFLIATWNAAVYAGSIPAIVLNIPGTAASAATALDGHPLARKGKATTALRASIFGSVLGAFMSGLALLLLSPPLAKLSLMFGPAEMFAFAFFGLATIVSLSSGTMIKGLFSGLFGLLMATVGFAPSGALRFVYTPGLLDGFPIVTTLIGLFTVPEVLSLIQGGKAHVAKESAVLTKAGNFLLVARDWVTHGFNFLRSAVIGTIVGVLPGSGPTVAGFISYNEARRASKNRERFGEGEIAGVIAADTANNAAVLSSLVPALTLGIPGSVDAVIILAALTMHGLAPGPLLFQQDGPAVYTVFMGVFVANALMLLVGVFGARWIAQVTRLRLSILAPAILVFAMVGSFAVRNNWFDVVLALVIGLVGYGFRTIGIPLAPMVLGLILGPILERNLYQSIVYYSGRTGLLLHNPIAFIFMLLALLTIIVPLINETREARARRMNREAYKRAEERVRELGEG